MADLKQDVLSELRCKIAAVESGMQEDAPKRVGNAARPVSLRDAEHRGAEQPASALSDAKKKIERLCNAREQCSLKVLSRLDRDGFSQEVSHEAVAWAQRCGLIDDARYADLLVRSRYAAGRGLAGIERELRGAGIDPESIDQFQEYRLLGGDREIERAVDLLARKPPRAKNARDAAYRRLMQKGFSSSVSASAARLWWEGSERC